MPTERKQGVVVPIYKKRKCRAMQKLYGYIKHIDVIDVNPETYDQKY